MIVDIWLAAGLSIYHVSQSSVEASVTSASTSGFFPERRRPSDGRRHPTVERKTWPPPPGTGGEDGESDDGGGTDDDDDQDLYNSQGPLNSQSDTGLPGSQPLQTLEKLQQMLDATDYMTESQRRESSASHREQRQLPTTIKQPPPPPPPPNPGKLWMSGDRAKYKKLQHRLRHVDPTKWLEQSAAKKRQPSFSVQQRTTNMKDKKPASMLSEEEDDFSDATDDGLGYTLPDLPVYHSDAEDDGDLYAKEDEVPGQGLLTASRLEGRVYIAPGPMHPSAYRAKAALPPNFPTNRSQEHSNPGAQYVQPQEQDRPAQWTAPASPFYHPYNPYLVYPMPYGDVPNRAAYAPPMGQGYLPQPQQQQFYVPQRPMEGRRDQSSQPYQQQTAVPSLEVDVRPASLSPQPPLTGTTEVPLVPEKVKASVEGISPSSRPVGSLTSVTTLIPASSQILVHPPQVFPMQHFPNQLVDERFQQVSLVEAGSRLSFGSIQKISAIIVSMSLLSYAAVSPRSLPLTEYNLQFYENLCLVCLSALAPAFYMVSVFDARMNDINTVTNTFFVTFFLGYAGTFVSEIVVTTFLRLVIFLFFEREVFTLTPKVPIVVLPWVLRELKYRPKRITLFAADFATSCVVCPIIEECVKLLLLQCTAKLPRNFNWVSKSSPKRKKKRRVAEAIVRPHGEPSCINANQYVTHMLAVTLGLKLCDAGRRILLYTKSSQANKRFYAVCRGIFPIHDLCGAMTALALAKRDLLGLETPLWKLLAPAVVVHGMANFRGMKPIFKWNSATPWSEMQLSPLNLPDSSTFFQLMKKGYAKLMWLIIIGRVFGYCVKNYYLVNRQALKRTTQYAGNHAAFSAELATAELLKNQKKK